MGFRDVQDQLTEVIAPRSGVIAARWAKKGDTLPAGQPIVTLMDQRRVWIEANIDEKKIERVRPGQAVEIEIVGRDGKLTGKVETVSPVTASTLVSSRDRGLSGSSRRLAQVIPVKISLDEDNLSLIPGSSAEITIWVR
jgi:multidrug resistance efflux pump